MTPATPNWTPVPFVLAYRISDVTLFRKRFRGLALHEHFFDLPDDPNDPPPPFERFGDGVEAIVTRSHPVRDELPDVSDAGGHVRYVMARYTRFHTDLGGDFDGYLAKFSSKTRSTLKRKVRRFQELGEGAFMRAYRTPEEMETFHALARRVSALTYQEKLLHAGLPEGPGFLAELQRMAATDAVRAYVLFLGHEPIAYLCCPAVNGVLLYSWLGYDPRHAELSPGTVLQYFVFESLFEEKRFRAFDFTEGQGDHKKFFGTHQTPCADICYFPATTSARFWISLHRRVDQASASAGRTLDRLGVKARVKRLLRRMG